ETGRQLVLDAAIGVGGDIAEKERLHRDTVCFLRKSSRTVMPPQIARSGCMMSIVPLNDSVRPKSDVCCLSCGIGICAHAARTDLIFMGCNPRARRPRHRKRAR